MICSNDVIMASFIKLRAYCEEEEFKNWDPFDGANNAVFPRAPLWAGNRTARLFWIQSFKRTPINLIGITRVVKGFNPKELGQFLQGYCNLYRMDPGEDMLKKIHFLAKTLISLQSTGYAGSCWGYDFEGQASAFYQPNYTPSVIATCFIAIALIEAFELTGTVDYLETAISSSRFVLRDLNRSYNEKGDFCFSYSPKGSTQVFNASLLGSKLLGRIYRYTGDEELLKTGLSSIRYCCDAQYEDGSWAYGTLQFHGGTGNFHMGVNLEALYSFQMDTGVMEFEGHIERGLEFYLNTFFTENDIPKYYDPQVYPVDIRASAQLVLTIATLGRFKEQQPLINKVLKWAIIHMQDMTGYFYYQLRKEINRKVPSLRWAQSWMFCAFSEYLRCNSLAMVNTPSGNYNSKQYAMSLIVKSMVRVGERGNNQRNDFGYEIGSLPRI